MSKLDADLKARWVEALRSGSYVQTNGCLKDKFGYCCLGVLCDISGKGHWEPGYNSDKFQYITDEDSGFFGLPGDFDDILDDDDADELIDMNDSQEKNFSDIADYVEEKL